MVDSYMSRFAALPLMEDAQNWGRETQFRQPFSPFLLLSVLDLVGQGKINSNFIAVSGELLDRFTGYCLILEMDSNVEESFILSFYQLHQFRVWSISFQDSKGKAIQESTMRTIADLRQKVYGAKFPADLFPLLVMETSRRKLRQAIISAHFSEDFVPYLFR